MFEETQIGSCNMYSAEAVLQSHEGHASGSSLSTEPRASRAAQQTAHAQAGLKPTDGTTDSVSSHEDAPKANAAEVQLQFGSFGKKEDAGEQNTGEDDLTGTEPSTDATKPAAG
jgi:hypothetical protein